MSERVHDPFWQHDYSVELSDVQPDPGTRVRIRIHEASERFYGRHELIPLSAPTGQRDYFLAKPYILVPDYQLTVDLLPASSPSGPIGEVRSFQWKGVRHQDIGVLQAWYYPDDRTMVLWECLLNLPYQTQPPIEDGLLIGLWRSFERFLLTQRSDTRRIAAPSWEPWYHPEHWREFLEALGYGWASPQAFTKEVPS